MRRKKLQKLAVYRNIDRRTSINWDKRNLYIGGSEELKQKYMFDLTSGKKIAAFALTEPEGMFRRFYLQTNAKFDGTKWILNGQKIWITNAALAEGFLTL